MKSRVIQDGPEPTEPFAAPPPTVGSSHLPKELRMEAVAFPVSVAVDADAPYRGPAVSAQDVTRQYGAGETAVRAASRSSR